MNTISRKNKTGAAILIYLLVMAIFVSLLMAVTYSRLLLAVKRGQSVTDSMVSNYAAETEVNDLLARLSGGYLESPFNVSLQKQVGNTKLTIKGFEDGDTQTIEVTADRPFASKKIVANRTIESVGSAQSVDILLGLDCTQSMDTIDRPAPNEPPDTKRRIANLKVAALNFINSVPTNGRFRVGIFVFAVDAKWLALPGGKEITLSDNVSLTDAANAIQQGFSDTWATSNACRNLVNSTSVGTGFTFAHDKLKESVAPDTKQIEVIITDGEPNSRILYPACAPSTSCVFANSGNACIAPAVNFLDCASADTNTLYNSVDPGVRSPDVDAYAVTISTSPNGDAARVLGENLGDKYIPAARASELTTILSNILTDIVSTRESITIRKDIPG